MLTYGRRLDTPFELYHKEELKAMKKPVRWEGFHNELVNAGFIQSNLEVFNYVMEFMQLQPGSNEKIQWLTSKADALDIKTNFHFTMRHFNKCFRSKDDKPYTKNVQVVYRLVRNKALSRIIEKYRLQPQ